MLILCGVYPETEITIDLRKPGIYLLTVDAPVWESDVAYYPSTQSQVRLRPETTVSTLRTFYLEPPDEGRKIEGILVWRWVARYYWTPPGTIVGLRNLSVTIARLNAKCYQLELEALAVKPIQFVLDRKTSKILEAGYMVRRT
jgi:hypothetical protein